MLNYHQKLTALLALAILLTGCQGLFGRPIEEEAPTPTPIPTPIIPDKPTYVVQRGKITKQLEFTGRISPVEETELYFKAGGYVKRVLVERDDQVQAGDLLAELEIDDLLKQMAQAEVTLNTARLRLDEAEKALDRQIAQAELDLDAVEVRLTQTQKAHADAVAQAELDLDAAEAQLTQAQNANAEAVAQAELDLDAAETRLTQAQNANAAASAQAELDLKAAEAQLIWAQKATAAAIAQAELDLDAAQAMLAQTESASVAAVAQARIALSVAQEQLARLRAQKAGYAADVVTARIGFVQAQDGMARAGIEYEEALERHWESEEVHDAYARSLQQAEWSLEIAQARLDQALVAQEVYTHELRIQEFAVTQAEMQLAQSQGGADPLPAIAVRQAQQSLDRLQESADPLLTIAVQRAQQVLDRLKQGVDPLLTIELQRAQQKLEGLKEGVNPLPDLEVQWARQRLDNLREEGGDPLLAIEVLRGQQQLGWLKQGVDPVLVNGVNQAQLALERLQAQVADAQIVAPMDGQVLSVSIYAGRSTDAFKPVVIVVEPSAIEVSADLASSQLKGMVEGQEAVVSLRAYPGQAWPGVVRRLPYPYGSGGSTEGLAGADKSTRVSLEGDLGDLQLGDLARVIIVLEEKDGALWLPPAAIRNFQGREFVIVQDANRQRRVDVTIGLGSDDRVEILEGLEEGQIVVGQ